MKRLLILSICVFVLGIMGTAQEIIENPAEPLNKNAGRMVKLKVDLVINDTGDEYYFRTPKNIKVSPEGFIFIQDREQLLQFDEKGKYIKNFFKKGKGPGEVEYVSNFCLYNGNLIVHDRRLNKIIWFEMSGKLIKEFRIYEKRGKLGGRVILNRKKYTRPPQKYLNDIKNLLIYKNRLWVVTSTIDDNKGILIDVFNIKGKYLDNFYLKFPMKTATNLHNVFIKFYTMAVYKGAVYMAERNKDGTYRIVKYTLEDK